MKTSNEKEKQNTGVTRIRQVKDNRLEWKHHHCH